MNQLARNVITSGLRMLERDLDAFASDDSRRDEYADAAEELRDLISEPERPEAAEPLELFAANDRQTIDSVEFAFSYASCAIDSAARRLAKARANWHDDPEGDPEGYAEHHAPAAEQFSEEARAAVVMAMMKRCERIRQENIINANVGV